MPDDSARSIAFELAVLQRLDAIERAVLAITVEPAERDLLREILRKVGDRLFSARELTALAEEDHALRAAIIAAVGVAEASRRIGKLLARCAGQSVGGVQVMRRGTDREGSIWRVWSAKLTLPVDSGRDRGNDRV